ncbi:DNA recombination protein RmuC [Ferribacterium limneticum]|uniref:DNA recombination protein RmuC n=1 Tax=Ferribacterium limneticum TaxID=76259 RepID=UPI001CF98C8C|nr:DNA recombination protein RmuC [Ferribacterium limneticum]UCV27109.1 DNA recombination protein RmuC [Ferribacterium limneticum]UCV31026.1 DNA recombination protein RmuC [Ferribacterium limneticum]
MSETMGLALAVGTVVIILLQVALLLRGNRKQDDAERFRVLQEAQEKGLMRLERELREELARGRREDAEEAFRDREERAQSSNLLSQAVTTQVGQFGTLQAERLEAFARELNRFSLGLDERFERLKLTVEGRLTAIQMDNANKLEEMRRTVDEKLHATLEQRLGESFKLVSDRLEQVHRGLGEMQTLAAGVGDLKRVLTNVKTRGTWGEVQLSALLEQLLTADQFASNVVTRPGSNERVDFAIRLPGKDDGAVVWLPIDAKYPIEDYQRLLDAQERADPVAVEEASRAIETRLKNEAKSIHEKYVSPPHTTDFAMLYLPLEGLYAEGLRRPGLAETLQRDFRVSLAGPTTLAALLNSLQMGFRTLAIEQRSAEVWAVLGAVKTEFGKFGEALAHTRKKLDEASNSIAKAETRTRQLSRKLKEVEALPAAESEQLIGVVDLDGEDE